ncbi:DUF4253 domain-containing protein [Alteriqipengyuania sp. NZ-12B]|uniref:DUF4253 domain-containing protein n=2 Tax=Alteriqipengyuania abyssalis TaxID=2860200 RepID=A0ABS7PBB9_9SPHN|nr:DUF4253 domain-containing protein [Alteriqipengyuania abyssalis]
MAAMLGLARHSVAGAAAGGPQDEMLERMRAAFPYPIATVPGQRALAEWQKLSRRGGGWPIIISGDEALERVLEQYSIDDRSVFPMPTNPDLPPFPAPRTPQEILTAAERIEVGAELQRLFDHEYGEDPFELEKGEWPQPHEIGSMGLSVDKDILTGAYLDKVHLCVLPTEDSADAAAYLRWGNWNACPPPEVHVAVHRKWHAEYGAQVVGMSGDVIGMRVTRRPASRGEALALAQEQYLYCSDIVLQGTETLEPLAAGLMESDWWYFWWD